MLDPTLLALAAAGGSAVVQAAGTDAWGGLRQAVARWFGRGDQPREQGELERLDETAAALEGSGTDGAQRVMIRQEAVWQTRFEGLLESMDAAERNRAGEQLRVLLVQHAPQAGVPAGEGGLTAGGNVEIHADGGSIAAGVLHGGAQVGTPTVPGSHQG